MESFIKTKVFNPNLSGEAVRIKGYDVDGERWDRLFLVKKVNGEYITLINCQGEEIENVHIENFVHAEDGLKIIVLEEKE